VFSEYFNGDNGSGVGASHQTGWTGTVALLPLLLRGATVQWVRARRGVLTEEPSARAAGPGNR
jgi:hypothetical protein